MFNITDDASRDWAACLRAAAAIRPDPANYYAGLPDPILHTPKNILFFTRKAAFDQGRGSAHHRFLLIFCLQGEGSVIVDEQVLHLVPGHALLIPPHHFHHYTRFTGSKLLWLFMSFELDEVEAFHALQGNILRMTRPQISCLRQLASHYAAHQGAQTACPEVTILATLLLETFRRSVRKMERATAHTEQGSALLRGVARYVHQHVTEPISIADVAKDVGLSESHLRAKFRMIAGVGLGTYIRRMRHHRARTMMLATDLRLKEIAEACGYDSIYTFSRAFSQAAGMSASAYRARGRRSQ